MYHDMKKKPFFRHFLLTAALAGCISSGCLPEALSLCFPPFQEKDSPFSSFLLRTYAAEEGGAYAFAALLPKEGISLDQYISSLTGQDLQNLLSSPADIKVNASVPKFDIAFSATFSDELKNMGMELPLTSEADFSGIGTFTKSNFGISGVLHKTRMIVDERGTKAAAASATILLTGFPKQEEFKTVCLNRPFLCMIIDTQNRIPLFMGAVRTLDS